ncbi:MAG TPA: HNH endonuclease signature motif containing protein [Bdellovibrionales bacterium]|nr:HNH endonuclease signature motif containing protein [Bdellovibrionales bacterium]
MNLFELADETLLQKTDELVREERELLTAILHHLREINARRLYSKLKYKSLFEYAVRRLGYSEDQAYRRISAMKLLGELPRLEEQLSSGALSLTTLGLAQTYFRNEEKSSGARLTPESKTAVLESLEHKSAREAEQTLLSLASTPSPLQPDQARAVSAELVEFRFTGTKTLENKIATVRGLLAHSHPQLSLGELFETLCDLMIAKRDPAARPSRTQKQNRTGNGVADTIAAPKKSRVNKSGPAVPADRHSPPMAEPLAKSASRTSRRRLAAHVVRDVWARAKSRCTNCGSRHGLEIDHVIPVALGGSDDFNNLRLVCRSCNQRAALETLGRERMEHFLNV